MTWYPAPAGQSESASQTRGAVEPSGHQLPAGHRATVVAFAQKKPRGHSASTHGPGAGAVFGSCSASALDTAAASSTPAMLPQYQPLGHGSDSAGQEAENAQS